MDMDASRKAGMTVVNRNQSMIPKCGDRFSEKIMLKQKD